MKRRVSDTVSYDRERSDDQGEETVHERLSTTLPFYDREAILLQGAKAFLERRTKRLATHCRRQVQKKQDTAHFRLLQNDWGDWH